MINKVLQKLIVVIWLLIYSIEFFCHGENTVINSDIQHFNKSIDKNLNEKLDIRQRQKNNQTSVINQKSGHDVSQLLLAIFGALFCAFILTLIIIFGIYYAYKKNRPSQKTYATDTYTGTRTSKPLRYSRKNQK